MSLSLQSPCKAAWGRGKVLTKSKVESLISEQVKEMKEMNMLLWRSTKKFFSFYDTSLDFNDYVLFLHSFKLIWARKRQQRWKELFFKRERKKKEEREESSLWVNKGPWWLQLEAGLICQLSEGNHFTPTSRFSGFSEIRNTCYLFSGEDFCAKHHVTSCEVISDWRVGWGLSILSKTDLLAHLNLGGRTGQQAASVQGPS